MLVVGLPGIPYLGITKSFLDIDNPALFDQLLIWVQTQFRMMRVLFTCWGSLPCTKWSLWQEVAKHKDPEYHIKLE